MLTARDLADRICDEIDRCKATSAMEQASKERTGRPIILFPITPETRDYVAAMIDNWSELTRRPPKAPYESIQAALRRLTEPCHD